MRLPSASDVTATVGSPDTEYQVARVEPGVASWAMNQLAPSAAETGLMTVYWSGIVTPQRTVSWVPLVSR